MSAASDAGLSAVDDGRGDAADLLRFQRQAWSGLVFSVTRRCPLQCSHCITRSGPDAAEPVLAPALAAQWADELPQLVQAGLRHVSFTGGEPVLALEAVSVLSAGAVRAGIANYLVTSAAWASTPATAARIGQRLATVTHWDVGFDDYHGQWMPRQRLVHAITALEAQGATYTVRACCDGEGGTLAWLAQQVGPGGRLLRQPVRALGRAAAQRVQGAPGGGGLPHLPCMSTGLLVRADGSTGPCCSGLAYEARGDHPFEYGGAQASGALLQAWQRWHADPLLRLLRLAGFGALEGWLAEEGLVDGTLAFPADPCETCVALWTRLPRAAARLAARAAAPGVARQLDEMERVLYGSVWSAGAG